MLRILLMTTILALAGSGSARSAQGAEPEIYYFGATGCDYCNAGLAFFKRLQKDDPRVRIHEYDIVASPDDATIFVRAVNAIGLLDPQVPLTVIGHHVIIGYQDDDTTGNEIALTLEQCRIKACPDFMHALVTFGPEVAAADPAEKWVVERRFAKAAQRR
jgi:thiol-disulfide isomerase/thioredoxin